MAPLRILGWLLIAVLPACSTTSKSIVAPADGGPDDAATSGGTGASSGSGGAGAGGSGASAGQGGMGASGGAGGAVAGAGGAAGSTGGSSSGGVGAGGSGGSAGVDCTGDLTAKSNWPDSTPHCSDGSDPTLGCPVAGEDGSRVDVATSYMSSPDMVLDDVTGLFWATAVGNGIGVAAGESHCADLNSASTGGRTDWRLASLLELTSLLDYGRNGRKIDPVAFSFVGDGLYWTSDAFDLTKHFAVSFSTGFIARWITPGAHNAMCAAGAISGGLVPRASCGTVLDQRTGLEWKVQSEAPQSWALAISDCAALGDGWRLPSVKELLSLFDPDRDPAFAPAFGNQPAAEFWSSTPVEGSATDVWAVDFDNGADLLSDTRFYANNEPRNVRCVRSAAP